MLGPGQAQSGQDSPARTAIEAKKRWKKNSGKNASLQCAIGSGCAQLGTGLRDFGSLVHGMAHSRLCTGCPSIPPGINSDSDTIFRRFRNHKFRRFRNQNQTRVRSQEKALPVRSNCSKNTRRVNPSNIYAPV